MSIAGIAARQADLDAMRASEAYTLTAVALIDGFVSCWDEKYRSCLVRPVTVINRHIDPDRRPILQTPSFPEYTSGHSVVSGAASTVLDGDGAPELVVVGEWMAPQVWKRGGDGRFARVEGNGLDGF